MINKGYFCRMTDGKSKKFGIKGLLEHYKERFAVLQEAQFDRGERELAKFLQDKEVKDYPIPTIVLSFLIWGFILCFPLVFILDPSSSLTSNVTLQGLVAYYVPLASTMVIFFVNQKILVAKFFFKKKYILFLICNALMLFVAIFLREIFTFVMNLSPGDNIDVFFSSYCFSSMRSHFSAWTVITFIIIWSMVCIISILTSIVMRLIMRAFILREKKRGELEYELNFLKQQLSPHFLFNTLNNITSLIRIDPDLAEKSMTKLSQLLRQMIYQTSDKFIALEEDVSILEKYAELERLRHDENFEFKFDVNIEDPKSLVEPLWAMPLMENAMKHCVNPDGKSFVHVSITQKGNDLCFKSENSNFPRKSKPGASGLGLTTFRKRLELMYAGNYSYEGKVENGVYISELRIKLKL